LQDRNVQLASAIRQTIDLDQAEGKLSANRADRLRKEAADALSMNATWPAGASSALAGVADSLKQQSPPPQATSQITSQEAELQSAKIAAALKMAQAENSVQEAQLEISYKNRLVSTEDYFAKRREIAQSNSEAEVNAWAARSALLDQLAASNKNNPDELAKIAVAREKLDSEVFEIHAKTVTEMARLDDEQTGKADEQAKKQEEIYQRVNKAYEQSGLSKKRLLDQEEQDQIRALGEERQDDEDYQIAVTQIHATYATKRREIAEKEAQEQAAILSAALKKQEGDIEKNPDMFPGQKQAALTQNYQAQLANQQSQYQNAQGIAGDSRSTDAEREGALKQIASLSEQIYQTQQKLTQLTATNNPFEQMRQSLVKMVSAWGTLSQQIGGMLSGTINTAINSLASNMTKVAMGAERWRDAVRQIENQILSSILNQILQMALRAAAMWLIPAILSTIGSGGSTASSAPMAVSTAIGGMAFSGGGLVDGPGTGTSDSIWARLSKGEVVFSAAAAEKAGPENLLALHQAILSGVARPATSSPDAGAQLSGIHGGGGSGQVNVEGHKVSIAMVHSSQHLKEWLATSEGKRTVVDIVKNKKQEIGIQT
jgi:hypothetical protein